MTEETIETPTPPPTRTEAELRATTRGDVAYTQPKRRTYPIATHVILEDGAVDTCLDMPPTEAENADFVKATYSGPFFFWHSGIQSLCIPTPQGFAGFKAKDLREVEMVDAAGVVKRWLVNEVEMARHLPRVPGTGLEIVGTGASLQREAEAAARRREAISKLKR